MLAVERAILRLLESIGAHLLDLLDAIHAHLMRLLDAVRPQLLTILRLLTIDAQLLTRFCLLTVGAHLLTLSHPFLGLRAVRMLSDAHLLALGPGGTLALGAHLDALLTLRPLDRDALHLLPRRLHPHRMPAAATTAALTLNGLLALTAAVVRLSSLLAVMASTVRPRRCRG